MIFIDTGAFIARYIADDQYHEKALEGWDKLPKDFKFVYTSNFVIDETITLLARKTSVDFAVNKASIIYQSGFLKILRPIEDDEKKAIAVMTKYLDQKLSYTDCISFVLMKKNNLKTYFGYDSHFSTFGFEKY